MTVSADIRWYLELTDDGDPVAGEPRGAQSKRVAERHVFLDGTADDKADVVYSGRLTCTASTTTDLDLRGVLTDPFGRTLDAAEIVGVLFRNLSTASAAVITVSPKSSGGWTGLFAASAGLVIPPSKDGIQTKGGVMILAPLGRAISGGSDALTFTNPHSADVVIEYQIIARSA